MFIREVKKQRSKTSKIFYQYNLVQAARINGKVRQRVILYLGSDKLLYEKKNRNFVLLILKSLIFKQPDLFPPRTNIELKDLANGFYEKYLIKYPKDAYGESTSDRDLPSIPSDAKKAQYEQVDVSSVNCHDVKSFGGEHLCSGILDKLGLDKFLRKLEWSPSDRDLALIGISSRALFACSEYKTTQYLKDNSDLISCIGSEHEGVSHKQLYRIADKLYQCKDQIDEYLYERITTMFNLEDKLVIFDLSNTYFETRKVDSELAQFGRSKEKRSDCRLVVFSGVINSEGFIRHSRIYEGNKPDTATIADMLMDLEEHSKTGVKKTVVIDAGIASEENLELIASKGYKYVCVARSQVAEYEAAIESKVMKIQLTDRNNNKVELKILKDNPGYSDTWMYVKSEAKRVKEKSMEDKLQARYLEDLAQIKSSILKPRGIKVLERVWERVGRIKEKYPSIAKLYDITVSEKEPEPNAKTNKKTKNKEIRYAEDLTWKKKDSSINSDHGVYFIRTNYEDIKEEGLWDIYNTIREVESTFRCLKSDLNIRPVHHQLDHRIQSHIYLTMLAYQLVNTIRYMLKQKGITHDWTNIVRIMKTHTIQTIQLPTPTKTIHLRAPATPIKEVGQIYKAANISNTKTAKNKYVVYH